MITSCRVNAGGKRGNSDEFLALDGGADGGKLVFGDVASALAEAVEAVKHVLITARENLGEVVAVVPRQLFHGGAEMENAFHRVAEAGVVALAAHEPQLDTSLGIVAKVETHAMRGILVGKVKALAVVLAAGHPRTVAGTALAAIEQRTTKAVVVVDDVIQLADCLGLLGLSRAKDGV